MPILLECFCLLVKSELKLKQQQKSTDAELNLNWVSIPIKLTLNPLHYNKQFLTNSVGEFVSGSDGKESTYNPGDPGSILGSGRAPGDGHGNPLQYSFLENLQGQRSLVGCSLWGCKKSNTIERLSTA